MHSAAHPFLLILYCGAPSRAPTSRSRTNAKGVAARRGAARSAAGRLRDRAVARRCCRVGGDQLRAHEERDVRPAEVHIVSNERNIFYARRIRRYVVTSECSMRGDPVKIAATAPSRRDRVRRHVGARGCTRQPTPKPSGGKPFRRHSG